MKSQAGTHRATGNQHVTHTTDMFHPEHFINRELSSLEFNARVLEEAENPSNPLLERVKFLAIFSCNLDEFFMIRVAGLREQAFGAGAPQDKTADVMPSSAQLSLISRRTRELITRQYECWNRSLLPALKHNGIEILDHRELGKSQHKILDRFFQETASLVLTPMAIDPSHPSPQFHNQALYLAAQLARKTARGPKRLFAVIQLPPVLPRLVPLGSTGSRQYVFLEHVVASKLPELFGGYKLVDWTTFRITRDSDLDLLEQESDDMLRLIEERLRARRRAEAVRLEVPTGANAEFVQLLIDNQELRIPLEDSAQEYSEVYFIPGSLDLTGLMSLVNLDEFGQLRNQPFTPKISRRLRRTNSGGLYAEIDRRDILLHHPYDSFAPVVQFVRQAATDPEVLAIKQTLYRTSGDSPIVRSLIQAAENGKQVTAIVELKARFDEAANVTWAREMERAGVHVVFGFMDLKTHCKVSMVVRRDNGTLRRYVHLSTGNYHPATAKLYTDLGLFTADEDLAADASALFNLLTGYSQGHNWRKLIIAPDDLRRRTIELIGEQARRSHAGNPSRIFAKLNSLVDQKIIESLYRASQAGVPIELVVRGICCLRPGMAGISETITVRSVVDRFLEHSRIFVFGCDDATQVYLSSADWMPRNFVRRVEVMFPIEDARLRKRILREIVPVYLSDNARARLLSPDGSYQSIHHQETEPSFRCQQELLKVPDETDPEILVATMPHVTVHRPISSSCEDAGSIPKISPNQEKIRRGKWLKKTQPDQPISSVARQAVSERLEVVCHYLPLAAENSKESVEYVHQLRVASRRASQALKVFEQVMPPRRTKRLVKKLSSVRRTAGAARDLDVLGERLKNNTMSLSAHDRDIVENQISVVRQQSQGPLVRNYQRFKDGSFQKQFLIIVERIRWRGKTPEPDLLMTAQGIIPGLANHFFSAGLGDLSSTTALHNFRIHGKRLRYAMELFSGAFPEPFRQTLYKVFQDVQRRLGRINDDVTAEAYLTNWRNQSSDEYQQKIFDRLSQIQLQLIDAGCRDFQDWWTDGLAHSLRQQFKELMAI